MNPYHLLRPSLFALPPEAAHDAALATLRATLSTASARGAARRALAVNAPELRVARWGIEFPNPVGLAAGLDKAGTAFNPLGALGFGFIEIGTVTGEPQPGNPRPRLFRLPADRALINRMGFNNPGALAVAEVLRRAPIEPVLGINIGKSKVAPLDRAIDDYLKSVDALASFARYLVVNVSSPNTPGLRSLQDAEPLRALIRAVVERARERVPEHTPPVLVKLAPDLTDPQIEEAVGIAVEVGARGIIATNTTIARTGLRTRAPRIRAIGAGGLSGAPLAERARELVRVIRVATGGRVPVIGVGGIFGPDDAWKMMRAGASLVQVYTGFIYEGPALPRMINQGLLQRLRREGAASIDEIIGTD